MYRHAILAFVLAMFGFTGGSAAAADRCCCGKDARCCESTAGHECCGDQRTCGGFDYGGDPDGPGDAEEDGGHHA